jgi:glycosyltransferase involved in cell wall biosynthesis
VKDYVNQNNLTDVIQILDAKSNIENYFKAFDLFVMPSDQETYGLVLVEAMLCGTLSMAFNK